MALAMNMSHERFKEKLSTATKQQAKKKTDDSQDTKKELKKLQQQVIEIKESQMAQRAESGSGATEDSGWGSDENPFPDSNLCELVPKVRELLSVHKPDSADALKNGETAQAEGCDFEMTIKEERSSDEIIDLWDSDESDGESNEGTGRVHVINMTQRSKKDKKKDKKKDNLQRSRQSDARPMGTAKRQENTSEERPKDELTSDLDRSEEQVRITKVKNIWKANRNTSGKACSLCESREQDPECAENLCYECCGSTRINNYKCSACCGSASQAKKIKELLGKIDNIKGKLSGVAVWDDIDSNQESEVKDRDPTPQADWNTVDAENPRYPPPFRRF